MSKKKIRMTDAEQMSIREMMILIQWQSKQVISFANQAEMALKLGQPKEEQRILDECARLKSELEIWENV